MQTSSADNRHRAIIMLDMQRKKSCGLPFRKLIVLLYGHRIPERSCQGLAYKSFHVAIDYRGTTLPFAMNENFFRVIFKNLEYFGEVLPNLSKIFSSCCPSLVLKDNGASEIHYEPPKYSCLFQSINHLQSFDAIFHLWRELLMLKQGRLHSHSVSPSSSVFGF